jgi:hypothetical protein
MTYKLFNNDEGKLCTIIKTDEEGKRFFIPVNALNRDYQEYLAWVAEGNTAEAAD